MERIGVAVTSGPFLISLAAPCLAQCGSGGGGHQMASEKARELSQRTQDPLGDRPERTSTASAKSPCTRQHRAPGTIPLSFVG
jgi:hypothetical protein